MTRANWTLAPSTFPGAAVDIICGNCGEVAFRYKDCDVPDEVFMVDKIILKAGVRPVIGDVVRCQGCGATRRFPDA